MKKNKPLAIVIAAAVALILLLISCTKMVDNSEIGIKFKKFSLTDQGQLIATEVTGLIFYNPIFINV